MIFCGVIKEPYLTEKGFYMKYVSEESEIMYNTNYSNKINIKIGFLAKKEFNLLSSLYFGDPWKNNKRLKTYLQGNNITPIIN